MLVRSAPSALTCIRQPNFIERTLTRRRVKVIGQLPASAPACRWCGRCCTGAAADWPGVQQTTGSTRLLAELRRELFDRPPSDEEVVAETAVRTAA